MEGHLHLAQLSIDLYHSHFDSRGFVWILSLSIYRRECSRLQQGFPKQLWDDDCIHGRLVIVCGNSKIHKNSFLNRIHTLEGVISMISASVRNCDFLMQKIRLHFKS